MGNSLFKSCSDDEEINLNYDIFKYKTSKGPPVFIDDTFTTNYTCFRCLEELC